MAQIDFGLLKLLGKPDQFGVARSSPPLKSLCFLTELVNRLLYSFFEALLFGDDFVLRFLNIPLVFWRIGAVEFESRFHAPNPCRDVGCLDRTNAVDLLNITPFGLKRRRESVGRQLGQITGTGLRDACSTNGEL
jgi:hypothetical protein